MNRQADVVLCAQNSVSHNLFLMAKDVCKTFKKPLHSFTSFGNNTVVETVREALETVTDENSTDLAELPIKERKS